MCVRGRTPTYNQTVHTPEPTPQAPSKSSHISKAHVGSVCTDKSAIKLCVHKAGCLVCLSRSPSHDPGELEGLGWYTALRTTLHAFTRHTTLCHSLYVHPAALLGKLSRKLLQLMQRGCSPLKANKYIVCTNFCYLLFGHKLQGTRSELEESSTPSCCPTPRSHC